MAEPRRRGPATFRERDVRAAIRAAQKAGATVYAAEIARDGTIRVIVSADAAEQQRRPERNPWDDEE